MRRLPFFLLCSISASSACVSPAQLEKGPSPSWSAPSLEHVVSVRDGRTGERIGFEEMLDRLSEADAVFLGETHIDETTHRVELATYEGLLARRDGRVVLAMEMFERDVQPALDAYLSGSIDEPAFLSQARPWSNYRTAYRPLIELAKARQRPVVASNFPSTLRRTVSSEGLAALDPKVRALAPAELLANTPAYWRRVDNAVRGHASMMGPPPAAGDPRLTDTQSLWDNSMGESCALALRAHQGHAVLHVNGGFHSEYWDGTARQFQLRAPDARIATVAVIPAANPTAEEIGGAPVADFVVFAEERAQDVNEGQYAVFVPRKLEYKLHVPPQATASAPVPLLIWLADEGETVDDAFALWKARLGDLCAIAVIEAPYRELQDDLVAGGRWYWPGSFPEDISALREGIERAWAFVLRHQPVDPARVCLAGEGTGATVASAVALLSSQLEARALAFDPRRFASIKDFPLPLPESRGDQPAPKKSLRVSVREADAAWWSGELAEYRGVGFDADLAPRAGDAWSAEIDRENAVRAALGLASRDVATDAPRAHVRVDGPRAKSWARRLVDARSRRDGSRVALLEGSTDAAGSTEIALAVRASDFAQAGRLPQCPGSFGGTTIVVLPGDLAPEEAEAWRALEKADPLSKASRFHRLVLAEASGERTLPVVLAELVAKKRTNVLVVPATWCADGPTMRALQRSAREFEDRMTLQWRPGLGGLEGP
ncbi:MAG: ChaN family lipoprotein [Planctomycetota bacterium]|nr:ChaN family lipoprotein [Planctomycetota bacterium]